MSTISFSHHPLAFDAQSKNRRHNQLSSTSRYGNCLPPLKPEDKWPRKRSPDTWSWYIFNAFIHVYSPRAGADNPLGTNVDVNRKPLSLCPFVARFKTISLKSDFIHVFHVFPHVYSHGQGQTTHWGHNFDANRKAFSLCPYVASFKIISSKSDFIHIFNDFIHVYSPGARAYNTLGANF